MIKIDPKRYPFSSLFYRMYCGLWDPYLQIFISVDKGLRLMKWIWREEKRDAVYDKPYYYSPLEWEIRKLRTFWRIGSLTIIGLNVGDVLCEFVKRYAPNLTTPTWCYNASERRKPCGLHLLRFYRNKIFAHFSFAYPRKDSLSLQLSSLAILGDIGGVDDNGNIYVGGGAIISDNELDWLCFKKSLSIDDVYFILKDIFKEWYRFFSEYGFGESAKAEKSNF